MRLWHFRARNSAVFEASSSQRHRLDRSVPDVFEQLMVKSQILQNALAGITPEDSMHPGAGLRSLFLAG